MFHSRSKKKTPISFVCRIIIKDRGLFPCLRLALVFKMRLCKHGKSPLLLELSTAGAGLTDMVEKTSIIFVGTPLRSATNSFVAKKEEDIMRHLIKLFVPPRGILLGNLQV